MTTTVHKPVLLKETFKLLNLKPGETLLDGTFGGGGHSRAVYSQFGERVRIIGLDQDPRVKEENPEFEVYTENFSDLDQVLKRQKIDQVDAILLDLGISSDQLERSGKGFSLIRDEPLDMRMGDKGPTAAEILNHWDEETLEVILRGFGEEKNSRKFARAIVEAREKKLFQRTTDLLRVIEEVRPRRYFDKIHPATQAFQALRIAVNAELDALEIGMRIGFQKLRKGGRMVVISFHSLEDRMVKNFFRELEKQKVVKILTKKPLIAKTRELQANPRARSAKLRAIKKTNDL